jgi:hypothetical protein
MNLSLVLIKQRRMIRVEEWMIALEIFKFNLIGLPTLLSGRFNFMEMAPRTY